MSEAERVYEELGPITREEAEAAFASGDHRRIGRALLRLALHEDDWEYAELWCLRMARHPEKWVRRNACTSLGHLARLHGRLHVERVMPVLVSLWADPDVTGYAEDALGDIEVFLKVDRRPWLH